MKNLTLKDFKLHRSSGLPTAHYFEHIFKNGNKVCLETCFSGYDVAFYDLRNDIIFPKECTELDGYLDESFDGTREEIVAITKALEIANRKIKENENITK